MRKRILCILLTVLVLLTAVPFAASAEETVTYPSWMIVCGKILKDGKQYVLNGGDLVEATLPATGGYVSYDQNTGVLTLDNINLTASDNTYGIVYSESTVCNLTVNLVGDSSVTTLGSAAGMYMPKVDVEVAGTGSLQVTSYAPGMDAMYVRSLKLDSAATLTLTANGTGTSQTRGLLADKDIVITKGTVTAQSLTGSGSGIVCKNLTVGGSAQVTAKGEINGINCGQNLNVTGGSLTVESNSYDAVWATGAVNLSGGSFTVEKSGGAGLAAWNGVSIGGTAEVTIDTSGTNIYTYDNDIAVSGGTLNLSSTNGNCFYPENSGVKISGGTVNLYGYFVTVYATKGLEISGGKVLASSAVEVPLYSPSDVTVSGGTVIATSDDTTRYSVFSNGTLTLNGDTVLYGNAFGGAAVDVSKCVLYQKTNVSFDSDGKPILNGGIGTVYGDPNVTSFVKPTNSVLGTYLGDVTVSAKDITYGDSTEGVLPEINVSKIALTATLRQGTDYTVEYEETLNAGSHTGKIVGVPGTGNAGNKLFSFNVDKKTLAYDCSGLTVSKEEDGTVNAAAVSGTLNLSGVSDGDDVTLAYDGITAENFADKIIGNYSVKLTVENAALSGDDAANYTLPSSEITVSATITASNKDEDGDHKCDFCGETVSDHTGGNATCKDKAICEICGDEYGEVDGSNHSDVKHFEAKAATADADGNVEYWYCSGCNKYFGDSALENEITLADTVISKIPGTSDSFDTALWFALLLISGGFIGMTSYARKRKYSAK